MLYFPIFHKVALTFLATDLWPDLWKFDGKTHFSSVKFEGSGAIGKALDLLKWTVALLL